MQLPAAIAREMPFARRDVDVDGVRLSVVDDGPRDAPTILFVHGNPTWSYLWRKLLAPARAAGFRVVAPDLAGFGASGKPTDPSYYTLRRHVDNLDAVARALDLRDVTLVMHDWGGPVGLGWAVRDPARVARLVVANTAAFPPRARRPLTLWHKTFASPLGYRLGVAFNLIEASAMLLGVEKRLPRAVRRAYRWPMKEKGGRIAAARFVQLVPDSPEHETAVELTAMWRDAPKLGERPVLVLWADKDPTMRAKFAAKWTEVGLNVVAVKHVSPDGGHFWQEDDPQPFVREILSFAR